MNLKQNKKEKKIKVIPLGGLGAIGMNMTLIEYGGENIIIDAGLMFPKTNMPGIDCVIPDINYLEGKKLSALLITHGHEDHIGAIPHLLRKFPSLPIYATHLTMSFINSKLGDYRNEFKNVDLREVKKREMITISNTLKAEFITVNHSIPDGAAIAINTPLGTIIHTGDFKIDLNPRSDKFIDVFKFSEYGEKGVLLMLADSTGAEIEGFSVSESFVFNNIEKVLNYNKGMIIVASFSSSIERLQDIVTAAKNNNKYVAFTGRSLLKYTQLFNDLGYLDLYRDVVIPVEKVGKYPRNKIVCVVTGTQGEPYSSLSLIANHSHKYIRAEKDDLVIFSSSIIPGNEVSVNGLVNNLLELGAKVETDKKAFHVSGHGARDDLRLLYRMVRPKYFIPIHGEKRQLIRHFELVESLTGIESKGFLLLNGDTLEIDKNKEAKKGEPVNIKNIYIDGKGVGDIDESVLSERENLINNGTYILNILVGTAKNGKYDIKVEVESKGFTYSGSLTIKDDITKKISSGRKLSEKLIEEGQLVAKDTITKLMLKNKTNISLMKYEVKEAVKKRFIQLVDREPVIIIFINKISSQNKNEAVQAIEDENNLLNNNTNWSDEKCKKNTTNKNKNRRKRKKQQTSENL